MILIGLLFGNQRLQLKKIEYNNHIKDELLNNLKLISTTKSKVQDFNDFLKYGYISAIIATL
jgi:hypothetical protein